MDRLVGPRETVHEVYRSLGIPVSEAFDGWLQAQAEREKKHQSRFEYSLGDFRLDPAMIEAELDEFYREYDWPRRSGAQQQETIHE